MREAEARRYRDLIGEVQPLPGAQELIDPLKEEGHSVILASSAKEDEVEHYVDLLDARELADSWTTSADVETTKPAPDLVESALDRSGNHNGAVMVGDSTFDCEAAERAGVPTIGLLTGGFSEQELRSAGAGLVFESPASCCRGSSETPCSPPELGPRLVGLSSASSRAASGVSSSTTSAGASSGSWSDSCEALRSSCSSACSEPSDSPPPACSTGARSCSRLLSMSSSMAGDTPAMGTQPQLWEYTSARKDAGPQR